jgi:hypothetical protein
MPMIPEGPLVAGIRRAATVIYGKLPREVRVW